MNNPFESLQKEIIELKSLVSKLVEKPQKDLSKKLYSLNEASVIYTVDRQTVRNHIKNGKINATIIGSRIFIRHSEIYDENGEVKPIKYKR